MLLWKGKQGALKREHAVKFDMVNERITSRIASIGIGVIISAFILVVLSSPMPPRIGMVEIIMGVGLTVGSLLLCFVLFMQEGRRLTKYLLCVSYFLLVPLMTGVLRGNSLPDMARDIAPLAFMVVIPLLIMFLPRDGNIYYRLKAVLIAILAVGLMTALQFHYGIIRLFDSMSAYRSRYGSAVSDNLLDEFIAHVVRPFAIIFKDMWNTPEDYLVLMVKCQDPAILFAAIYSLCLGLTFILVRPRRLLPGVLMLVGGGICTYEFSALGMRAFIGLTAAALIVFAIHLVKLNKVRVSSLIVAGVVGLMLTYTQLTNFAMQMWAKHQAAGLSKRHEELYAVFNTVSENLVTLLFGTGWGGLLVNPIYEAGTTRFTHSLISYWPLKTGVIGVVVMALFLLMIFRRIDLRNIWSSSHRLAVILAASAVFAIGLFFEPTYKMLSFGLIAGLVLAEFSSPRESASERMPNGKQFQLHANR